jgi:galactokinase
VSGRSSSAEAALRGRVTALLAELPEGGPARAFRAPGRVNLMGDHTDYNDGLVLPAAIDRDCLVVGGPRSDGRVRVRSLDQPGAVVDVAADGGDEPAGVEPEWGRYVAGVVRKLAERGRPGVGVDAVLASTVPMGGGLASSAALEVACALALCTAGGLELSTAELARACRDAEEAATGVPCGLMDQLVALHGTPGHALLIDCRSLSVEPVPLPPGLSILAVHSGLGRRLAQSEYGGRRRSCEALAESLGLPALRDASSEQVAAEPLGRHVVSEIERVRCTAMAFRRGSLEEIGRLFAESHASLRDDFGVSTPELDALVEELDRAGAVGTRLTGAGFGGCVVSLVREDELEAVLPPALERYRGRTGLEPRVFNCRGVGGAGEVAFG